ncbi:MAG: [FeFe] hydrogenase H-cluster radical SAM maturase HydG [Candidatus Micrarchaeia archaeon]
MTGFVDEEKITRVLMQSQNASKQEALGIIDESLNLKGLSLEQASVLINSSSEKVLRNLFEAAKTVKEKIYGKRLVLFAPLYLSNQCVNNCLYCSFRKDNSQLKRSTLSVQQIREEVVALEKQGQKRLLLVAGESPIASNIDYLEKAIDAVYQTRFDKGQIRRVNVNVAPLSVENFKRLKKAGIGTYQLFQETYHFKTFKKMHSTGPKSNYLNRLNAMDRAQEAGIDDVGIGALFGLYNWQFELLALLQHCEHLEQEFNVGPHTISVPRIEPALNAPVAGNPPFAVSDENFKKMVAILRLSVPYTGMILSTREKPPFRDEVFNLGISQISAGSKTGIGEYSAKGDSLTEQFSVCDTRSAPEIIRDISKKGFYPSFCTACYRKSRTGKDFMDLAKPGEIQRFCLPNSILTFKEYALDYAKEQDKKLFDKVISKQLKDVPKDLKLVVEKKLKEVERGKRDVYL